MDTLSWTITSKNRREQVREFIRRSWFLFVIMGILSHFSYAGNYTDVRVLNLQEILYDSTYSIVGVLFGIVILLLVNTIITRRDRSYSLDNTRVKISLGKKTERFRWEDFDCFYNYSTRNYNPNDSNDVLPSEKTKTAFVNIRNDIEGDIFYLKKRTKYFRFFNKVFIVLLTKPENSKSVEGMLLKKLRKEKMKNTSDLGLVRYKFK